MKVERFIVLIGLCLLPLSFVCAEDRKPAMQIADNSFFDPTRKQDNEKPYTFGVEYRLEVGYVQQYQRTANLSYPNMFLHGARLGPMNFGIQTGLLYTLAYGQNDQHWRSMDAPSVQEEYIRHRVLEHNLTIPVRATYTFSVWKQLNIFFYGGPQLHIGLAENDYMQKHLSAGTEEWLQSQSIPTAPYDRYADDLVRANIQLGLGGGLEWDRYRLQAGYDFGLNNMVKHKQTPDQRMNEWGWYVSFSYRF